MYGVCVGGLIGLYVKVELLLLLLVLLILIDWLIRGEERFSIYSWMCVCVVCSLSNNLVNEHREREKLTMFVFLLLCHMQKCFYRYSLLIYKRKFSLFFLFVFIYLQEVTNADLNKNTKTYKFYTCHAIIKIPYLSIEQIETSSWESA